MSKFEKVKDVEEVVLPLRATKTSAGYDFYSTEDVDIKPQEKVKIKTNVKVQLAEGEFLLLVVRSSSGIKQDLALANTVGVIDADYYSNPDNDGNIICCLKNTKPKFDIDGATQYKLLDRYEIYHDVAIPNIVDLTEENTVHISKGDRIVQGIIVPYNTADNCNGDSVRTSGIGSTNK